CPRLRPLDEGDRVGGEVVLEQRRVLAVEATEPVQVEVRDPGVAATVALADREGRRGDRLLHAERPTGAADERRLAGAELARDDDHRAGRQIGGDPRSERFRVLRGGGDETAHPNMSSWSSRATGSAFSSSSSTGSSRCWGGSWESRPEIVAKSSRKVSLT